MENQVLNKTFIFGTSSYEVYSDGRVYSLQKSRFLPLFDNSKGYLGCNLYDGSKAKRYYIHRLVAEMFIPNTESLPDINHKDGNKSNNDWCNLEWMSRLDNMRHAHSTGLFKKYKENMDTNQNQWVGKKNSTREVIEVLHTKTTSGNYAVNVRCVCGNVLSMYFNDFLKDKNKRCIKCPK